MRLRISSLQTATVALLGLSCVRNPAPAGQPEFVIHDRTTCIVSGRGMSPERMALQCATVFVRLNGYTEAPAAADTMALAWEPLERGNGWRDLLQQRHGTLRSEPLGLCANSAGYVVGFEYSRDAHRSIGRGVTMTSEYTDLRVEHIAFNLDALRTEQPSCRLVAEIP